LEYRCELVHTHHRTSGHTPGYLQDALEKFAKEGWRLHSIVELDELNWIFVLEKQ